MNRNQEVLANIMRALLLSTRGSDVTGWYKQDSVLGLMFTDIDAGDKNAITTMLSRVSGAMRTNLTLEQFSQISLSLHLYPEAWEHELCRRPSDPVLYPDLFERDQSRKLALSVKRAIDVLGSALGLVLLMPVFILIAAAIKMSSKGPVFFRQQRVGKHGRPFVFLKFRSMYANNDARVHQQWFQQFLSGQQAKYDSTRGCQNGSFKMTHDPRVTHIGWILRRSSLDELPQLINVLKGEMSLVGPRPPIPYEVDSYRAWHRRRILEVKPGLTGLWQVKGRSRVTFDEMVRLDLRYARQWSLWLDFKILLQTPRAVLLGDGAY